MQLRRVSKSVASGDPRNRCRCVRELAELGADTDACGKDRNVDLEWLDRRNARSLLPAAASPIFSDARNVAIRISRSLTWSLWECLCLLSPR
ncbi:hypothetical protein TGMAS_208722 [Toxoplasma gondii MAS]|uniref:Uncharacterized protein n=1 Tax=Toxoplasma gondii MAS TaxID=943118 RepID=A0A086QSD0_TOXGO|nr:hypothetical protein TGMAS_208722 [Toxoplasma gondii MAS]